MAASTNATKLANLVNPQVLADIISAKLTNAIAFAPLAVVDRTLEGRAGSTITVPSFVYIGDATVVAEGADIPIAQLTTSTESVTVKKYAKGFEITDEAILSGYGDPLEEGTRQTVMSIANAIDNALLTDMRATATDMTVSITGELTFDKLITAKTKFGEAIKEPAVLIVNSSRYAELMKDSKWTYNDTGAKILVSGYLGEIGGMEVLVSDKLTNSEAFIVRSGALAIYMKRNVEVETDRDIVAKLTVVTTDEHCVTNIRDKTKVIKLTITAASGT